MTAIERELIYQAAVRQLQRDKAERMQIPESVIVDRVPHVTAEHTVSPYFTLALQLACDEFNSALHEELDRP